MCARKDLNYTMQKAYVSPFDCINYQSVDINKTISTIVDSSKYLFLVDDYDFKYLSYCITIKND